MNIYSKRKCCAACNKNNFTEILDLKEVPLAGYFPNLDEKDNKSIFPLKLLFCNTCSLVQTDSVIDSEYLFKDYRYSSSIGLSKHFSEYADILNKKYSVNDKNILEIGSNDGVLLEPLSKLGANITGVEPSDNISLLAKEKGLDVINDFFTYKNFKDSIHSNKYDLVLSNNAFAHIIDLHDIVKGIQHVLKDEGLFIFEVHYLDNLIKENQWDNIYHEHIYYYSITALKNLFSQFNMTVIDFEEIPIHAGSIRVTVSNSDIPLPKCINERIKKESYDICNQEYLLQYSKNVYNHINDFNNQILDIAKKYNIAGYGASGRANMFCNITNIDNKLIKFIIDESPERNGRFIANRDIPIFDLDHLKKDSDIDLLIIFAWNYSKMIINKTQFKSFKYLVAFPTIKLVDEIEELENFKSI